MIETAHTVDWLSGSQIVVLLVVYTCKDKQEGRGTYLNRETSISLPVSEMRQTLVTVRSGEKRK